MLFAKPMYYADFADSAAPRRRHSRSASAATTSVRSSRAEDRRRPRQRSVSRWATTASARTAGCPSRTDTILGKRVMEIDPRGTKPLGWAPRCRWSRAPRPTSCNDAFSDLTKNTSQWDLTAVKQLSTCCRRPLTPAVRSSRRRSRASRASPTPSASATSSSKTCSGQGPTRSPACSANAANRSTACWSTPRSSSRRSTSAARKWTSCCRTSAVSQQFAGFINDNPNLNNVLSQLQVVSDVLANTGRPRLLDHHRLPKFMGAPPRASAPVPYFKTLIVNLLPYQIIQPWVDAAFKSAGSTRRSSGATPACRHTGSPTRTARPSQRRAGARPAGPRGHPRSPGSRGSPARHCSYTPGLGGGAPRATRCRAAATQGSLWPGARWLRPAGCGDGAAEPGGRCAEPRVPAAAVPGEAGPLLPALPARPFAPGPPGARTVHPFRPACFRLPRPSRRSIMEGRSDVGP